MSGGAAPAGSVSGANPGPVTRLDHGIGAVLCVLYVAVLLATAPDLGLSRDESTYVVAAQSYARWFELLASDPSAALERAVIDRHWGVNHEHPPLAKGLFALSYLADRAFGLFTRESLPFRFVGMLSAGLLLWLIHVFGTRLYGRRAGLFAALAYALLPRPFYHSHLDAFDVPITLAVTAVAYAYLRALTERRWALWCGVAFGLALATKHNSWVLPPIFAIHFGWVLVAQRRGDRTARVSPVPWWLFAMLVVGPLLFFGSWPWMWHDTGARLAEYVRFHVRHEYYNMEYFGVNYFWPPFPVSFPWVMLLYTVPVTTLGCAVIGLTLELRRVWSRFASRAGGDPVHANVLSIGMLLAPLVVISMPWTPIFGGTKHWFTSYPFMALLAGLGFERALSVWLSWSPKLSPRVLPAAAGALLLAPAAVETAHSHPFGLSHYGLAAGGVPGAADRGMNRQFWGFTTGSLTRYFDRHLPNGGSVWVCDTTHQAFRMLAEDGLMSPDIRPAADIARADYAIVHHELHFAEVDHQIWSTYGNVQPAHVLTYDGVPIISVYRNPRSKRAVP